MSSAHLGARASARAKAVSAPAASLSARTPPLILACPGLNSQGGCGETQRPCAAMGTATKPEKTAAKAAHATGRMVPPPGDILAGSERATGFEPTTSSLGSWHSTPELRPRGCCYRTYA